MQSADGFKTYVNPPSRKFSASEIRELAGLIRDYVDANPKASDAELQDGIVSLTDLYDFALQLRYTAPKA